MDVVLTSQLHTLEAYKEWILRAQESAEAKAFLHPLLIPLLKAFKHVFPREVPHHLPTKRSIQHKIDLIPSSTLPNNPAYQMNP